MSRGSVVGRSACAVVAVVAVALAAPLAQASAGSPTSAAGKRAIRAKLRKEIKRNPAALRRRSFLRRAALVNFNLPVTIRLRNVCDQAQNGQTTTTGGTNPTQLIVGNPPGRNCATQGTALNQRTTPSATVNLGPSLGTRSIAVGGSLAAVVQFSDTYDGGALGNVAIKLLPSTNRFLTTSSVPLLWNSDITDPAKRNDANFLKATSETTLLSEAGVEQGCGDFSSTTTSTGGIVPAGYNSLFHGYTPAGSTFGGLAGIPGFPYYDPAGPGGLTTPAGYLPDAPGVDATDNIRVGGLTGNNDWIGLNPFPFPTQTAPSTTTAGGAPGTGGGAANSAGGNPVSGGPSSYGNAGDTVLRTNGLHLAIAQGGTQVNLSTGTPSTTGALPTAQGSQNLTMGYSGGQANLFGNIPGKNVGIDVTVNLAAEISGIARIVDQDMFSVPLVSGNPYPAGVFNCHQVWTQTVQNYIPGVRLTGNLRIAPAITKDGKVRIAKATVQSDTNNPDRVALTACLTARSAYVDYNNEPPGTQLGFSNASTVAKIPYSTWSGTPAQTSGGLWPVHSDVLPVFYDEEFFNPANVSDYYTRYNANHPSPTNPGAVGARTACGTEPYALVRDAGLTGTVGGMPQPGVDMQANGVRYDGSQASVAGDITVNPLDVDVLLGDQP